jgi:NAD(P)-dependent dehydrogenase (short-subunit alcohol dehydrogenase family)
MSGGALVVNGTSRLGALAVEALTAAGRSVLVAGVAGGGGGAGGGTQGRDLRPGVSFVDVDTGSDEGWAIVLGKLAREGRTVDTLIVAPPADGPEDDPYPAIATAWLGAKYALPLFRAQGAGTLLTLGFAPPADGACAGQDAACESIRLLTHAALHDARVGGIVLRSNRLFCEAAADIGAVREAARFLTDERSRFLSGTEIVLAAGGSTGAADAGLAGKTILVTGATSGIGRAIAIEIGSRGGWVAVGGRKLNLAEETLAMVREAGGDGCVMPLDVTDAAAWAAAAGRIADVRGALHGLVNNAGEARNRPIEDLKESDLAFLAEINCRGVRLGMDAMQSLLAKGRGTILNISSVAGIKAGPGGSAYSASKAAMIGLSKGYAAAYAASGTPVRVNSVQPGLIWSESVADSLGDEGARQFRAMIEPKTPLGRVGTPGEVATAVAFLLSDAAAPISGQAISVSGGLELGWP